MAVNRKMLGGLLCALAATALLASGAAASQTSTPGVTSKQITIGGTFPLTGPAALYKTIPLAEEAYFKYVDAHGGVDHRMIRDIVLDDQYDAAQTVPAVTKLVEHDHVFAIVGSLGTAEAQATWKYLNQRKVPQVLLATGDSYWGACTYATHSYCAGGKKPYTTGWQPDYPGESRLYAKYILAHQPNAKIGILYQNDGFGTNNLNAFTAALGSHSNEIVDSESYNVGDDANVIGAHVGSIEAHGADTFVIFATPPVSIYALVTESAVLHWTPLTILSNVAANPYLMFAAEQNGAIVNDVISTGYVANQATQPNLAGVKLAAAIVAKYAPSLQTNFNEDDENIIYGFGAAWSFVYALQHAGKNPTRASLLNALHNMNTTKNPFVYPGMKLQTSSKKKDDFPMEQLVFLKWAGETDAQHPGNWQTMGGIVNSGH